MPPMGFESDHNTMLGSNLDPISQSVATLASGLIPTLATQDSLNDRWITRADFAGQFTVSLQAFQIPLMLFAGTEWLEMCH